MTETLLLIGQGLFLLLIYAFVWSIVRSSRRELAETEPVAQMPAALPPVGEDYHATFDIDPDLVEPAGDLELLEAVRLAPEPILVPPDPAAIDPLPGVEDPLEAAIAEPQATGAFDFTSDAQPRLVVEDSPALDVGREVSLRGGLTIGRSGANDLRVEDEFVSHMHARVVLRGKFYFISDLGSTNGTFVNDRRVEEDAQLRLRDVLRIGETRLRYEE